MSVNPPLFMPFLHKELCPAALLSSVLHLWPGLPDPPQDFHVPADFPLTPQEAAQYAEYMRDISLAAADRTPIHSLLAAEKQARHPDVLKEVQDIAAFAQSQNAEPDMVWHMRDARLAAQRALVRIWLLEERSLEVRTLEQRCRTLSGDLAVALGVELEDAEKDALLLTQDMQQLDDTAGPAVSWRVVLENAALFLPEHGRLLFTDAAICAELREALEQPAYMQAQQLPSVQDPTGQAPGSVESSVWQALGLRGPRPERPWLTKRFSFLIRDDA